MYRKALVKWSADNFWEYCGELWWRWKGFE